MAVATTALPSGALALARSVTAVAPADAPAAFADGTNNTNDEAIAARTMRTSMRMIVSAPFAVG